MLHKTEIYDDLEILEELASLRNLVKQLRLEAKMGRQNVHEDVEKVFQPVTDTETAQEPIGPFADTTKAIELKREETDKANNEIEDLKKYATNFDFPKLEPLSEVANSKKNDKISIAGQSYFKDALY